MIIIHYFLMNGLLSHQFCRDTFTIETVVRWDDVISDRYHIFNPPVISAGK